MAASKSSAAVYCCRYCLIALVLASLLANVNARPREGSPQNSLKEKYCALNEEQQETCQKCAKFTKSKYVYPMCCNEEDGVYKWCTEYVNYGQET